MSLFLNVRGGFTVEKLKEEGLMSLDGFFAELDAEQSREMALSRLRHELVMAEKQRQEDAEEKEWRKPSRKITVTPQEREKTIAEALAYYPKPEPRFEQADISRVLFTPDITPHCYLHSLPGRTAYQTPEPEKKINRRKTELRSARAPWEKLQAYNRLLDAVYDTMRYARALCKGAEIANELTEKGIYIVEGIAESDRKLAGSKLQDLSKIVELLEKEAVKACNERAELVAQIRIAYKGEPDLLRMARVWNS